MNKQKGFSAIHVVILLIIAGFAFLGYHFYEQSAVKKANAESTSVLNNLKTKLDDKMAVASSTPRIGLGAVLNDLATIKTEVSSVKVSECLEPAKESLVKYANTEVNMMTAFAGDRMDTAEDYAEYQTNKNKHESEFTKNLEHCKAK